MYCGWGLYELVYCLLPKVIFGFVAVVYGTSRVGIPLAELYWFAVPYVEKFADVGPP